MGTDIQTTDKQELSLNYDQDSIKQFRENLQNFTTLLNKPAPKDKIQKHQGYEYLPISTVEKQLAKMFFGQVEYEVISYQQIFNEIACHARIRVLHPVTLKYMVFDGLGSSVIQQDANTKVSDFMLFKKPNSLQLALPKSYAEAIKNAAKKIGRLYGSDINRKFEDEYEPIIGKKKPTPAEQETDRIALMIESAKSLEDLSKLKPNVPMALYDLFNQRVADMEAAQ